MPKQKIKFIVNPLAGTIRNKNIARLVIEHLDTGKYEVDIDLTQYAGHATVLAQKAVQDGFKIVVAVGGDGSINEVAKALVGTGVTMGILPAGSGNGLAMHLGLGRNIIKAFEFINKGNTKKIDACQMNGKHFFNLAGLGIDGLIAYDLKKDKRRGFQAYFKITARHILTYPFQTFHIKLDTGKEIRQKGFLLEIANGPEFGYGFAIVPFAKPDDGKMEVLLVKKLPKILALVLVVRLMLKNIEKSKWVETYSVKELTVTSPQPIAIHLDGEGMLVHKPMNFKILPKALQVIVP